MTQSERLLFTTEGAVAKQSFDKYYLSVCVNRVPVRNGRELEMKPSGWKVWSAGNQLGPVHKTRASAMKWVETHYRVRGWDESTNHRGSLIYPIPG